MPPTIRSRYNLTHSPLNEFARSPPDIDIVTDTVTIECSAGCTTDMNYGRAKVTSVGRLSTEPSTRRQPTRCRTRTTNSDHTLSDTVNANRSKANASRGAFRRSAYIDYNKYLGQPPLRSCDAARSLRSILLYSAARPRPEPASVSDTP
ncbi:hypothetical protein EVAR_93747_1 [Eumeta japonica]|uniref:Uncharacterized protein n=1 Tax=Eumeta variegata TaxID=151549 RepID=A0A4C1U2N2_EUMVA|nr:hypothetical protein EVAR_93747_1 [Eumeta japonica]